ncbi:F-box protein CPR1-like [Rutidosis leptorrhynchoides]|uniref:F-box protein CPR1-like n=1 Tax=Rutidosis leptorrhynchoides TaxID=125765 RepID=UPI003A99A10B
MSLWEVDDILNNILGRVPGKSLLRFKCVSQHWNRLISDPYFMKSRSRRMILLKHPTPLVVIDEMAPPNLIKIPYPNNNFIKEIECTDISIVGTMNGIVILVVTDLWLRSHMYLYNPLTRTSKLLDVMDRPSSIDRPYYAFGFGYGETTNDLKIIRFGDLDYANNDNLPSGIPCDVFDIKTSSWGTSPIKYLEIGIRFWGAALNVKEMVFSEINLPSGSGRNARLMYPVSSIYPSIYEYVGTTLGSLNGCLCIISENDTGFGFKLWTMMKEHQAKKNPWRKAHSFTFGGGLEGNCFRHKFHPMCILANGKILLTDGSNQFVIFDTSKDTYETVLNNLTNHTDSIRLVTISEFMSLRSIEYVESLVSPSDLCAAVSVLLLFNINPYILFIV